MDTWGPFIFLNFGEEKLSPVVDFLSEVLNPIKEMGHLDSLKFVRRKEYEINCNWKVICDNFLYGEGHVPKHYPSLAAGLSDEGYHTKLVNNGAI